jgi:hypothetical protein
MGIYRIRKDARSQIRRRELIGELPIALVGMVLRGRGRCRKRKEPDSNADRAPGDECVGHEQLSRRAGVGV